MIPRFVIILAVICLCIPMASATFTPIFSENATVHYNVSYVNAPASAAPIELPIFLSIVGLVLLILSFALPPSLGGEVLALMAPVPLLISAWQFLHIDIVTGYGSTIVSTSTTNFTTSLMESHTIYAMYPESIFTLIVFAISLLNIYRVVAAPKFEKDQYEE